MLVTVSVIDIECYRLPDRIVLPTMVASVVLVVVESLRAGEAGHIQYALAGAAIYFGFLLVVHLISPRGMGFGDVKLAAVMGLYLGWLAPDYLTTFRLVLWAMLVGFVIGSVVGIALWAIRGRNAAIPFGPFLAFGCAGGDPDLGQHRHHRPQRLIAAWASVTRHTSFGPGRADRYIERMLRFLTAGESHGRALVVILEGLPAGLPVTVEEIQAELARRRLGFGRGPRMRFEQDEVTILGGIRHGRTLGSPVAIEIGNSEWERKWTEEMSPAPGRTANPLTRPRPGHADLAGMQKYDFVDARDVLERASARETAARVAAGAVAKVLLAGHRRRDRVPRRRHRVGAGHRRRPAQAGRPRAGRRLAGALLRPGGRGAMIAEIKEAAKDGDSLGGIVEVLGYGLPVGLGSHVHWDRKLDGLLAQALMSIQAVKGVEIGDGFEVAGRRGSEAHDPISWDAEPVPLPPRDHPGRRARGRHDHRRAARGPGRHEAAGHAQPADARHRRHRHQGGDGVVQGAHRRHRRAGHGRGGRDDGRARAGRRGAAQVRRRLDRRARAATTTPTSSRSARPPPGWPRAGRRRRRAAQLGRDAWPSTPPQTGDDPTGDRPDRRPST